MDRNDVNDYPYFEDTHSADYREEPPRQAASRPSRTANGVYRPAKTRARRNTLGGRTALRRAKFPALYLHAGRSAR